MESIILHIRLVANGLPTCRTLVQSPRRVMLHQNPRRAPLIIRLLLLFPLLLLPLRLFTLLFFPLQEWCCKPHLLLPHLHHFGRRWMASKRTSFPPHEIRLLVRAGDV